MIKIHCIAICIYYSCLFFIYLFFIFLPHCLFIFYFYSNNILAKCCVYYWVKLESKIFITMVHRLIATLWFEKLQRSGCPRDLRLLASWRPNDGPLWNPWNITALCYRGVSGGSSIGPALGQETSASRTNDACVRGFL